MKDPTQMTIRELLSAMANICLPDFGNELDATDRATMYISLMLEASRRDHEAQETALTTMLVRDEA